jgi:carboxymethylenebutenolidase
VTDIELSATSSVVGGSSRLAGYLARPDGVGPWPGVVVVHESFGVDDVMRRQADHLAAAGYLTLLPDLFTLGGAQRCLISTFRDLGRGSGRAFNDIEAARRWLLDSSECTGLVGVIGFCMGGAFALLTASRGFAAAAVNYGKLPADPDAELRRACPIVGSYGGRDRTLRGAAAKLHAVLDLEDIPHDVKEYPNAGHSFLNDAPVGPRVLRPLFRVLGVGPEPDSTVDAWRRIEAFFDIYLRSNDPAEGSVGDSGAE